MACQIKQFIDINDLIKNAKQVHGKRYDYSKVDQYVNDQTEIEIICNLCKKSFYLTPEIHIIRGFNFCCYIQHANRKKYERLQNYNHDTFVKECKKRNGDIYLFHSKYLGMNEKILIKCLECNNKYYKIASYLFRKKGCKFCGMSQYEKDIWDYLQFNKIKTEYEKTFDECKRKKKLRFDFYLPTYNLVICMDGFQHFANVSLFNNYKKILQYRQENDRIKFNFCKDNNIRMLRIKYCDFKNYPKIIEKTLKSKEQFNFLNDPYYKYLLKK